MISETKLEDTFPYALCHLKDFSNPYRLVINNCRCRCYEIKDLLYDKIHLYFH